KKLIGLREELSERVSRTRAHFQNREEVSPDFAEQVKDRENDDVIAALEAEGRVELKMVEAALGRIRDGSYGTCIDCGEPVAEGRLQAIPYAQYCVACADKSSAN
ncbi:MAG: TraR/DksA family transcriptional regulator, partial [Pseudomonadales bacterium]